MRVRVVVAALVLVMGLAPSAQAQGGYMECMACQMVLGLVESTAGNGQNMAVDASRQCSILPAGDREACERFYAAMGPKFIKVLKERRAKGEGLDTICKSMGYCQ
jgi:hypothetical protein